MKFAPIKYNIFKAIPALWATQSSLNLENMVTFFYVLFQQLTTDLSLDIKCNLVCRVHGKLGAEGYTMQ